MLIFSYIHLSLLLPLLLSPSHPLLFSFLLPSLLSSLGLRLRQQLEGAQQDSLISRIASNPLERHKRITEPLPSSDENREIRESEREKVSCESIRESVQMSHENNSSIHPRHTAPTLPSATTSSSAASTFSIFQDTKPDKENEKAKEKERHITTATSFKIFDDTESENKKSETVGESALDRMRNKERERRVEIEKEMEMERQQEKERKRVIERVRETERERRAKEMEREQDRDKERETDRRAEEESARGREREKERRAKAKADADAAHHADLDAMLLEMGVGDSEDGTINTRLAR